MVPGAAVIIVSEAQGTKTSPVVTNAEGQYVIPNVTPDTYTVQVTMNGFRTLSRQGVKVSGGDRVVVEALVLQVGGTTESVTVTAESPMLQAATGERSSALTRMQLEDLPISQHTFLEFINDPDRRRRAAAESGRAAHRRRRSGQRHDRRHFRHRHRQQRHHGRSEPPASRDRRGQAAHLRVSGRVRPLEWPADLGGHARRLEPLQRTILRLRTELGLEREHLAGAAERPAPAREQVARLGLRDRRPGRQARRQQQAVLLLHPRVPSAHGRQHG